MVQVGEENSKNLYQEIGLPYAGVDPSLIAGTMKHSIVNDALRAEGVVES